MSKPHAPRLTRAIGPLLLELDAHMQKFSALTEVVADRSGTVPHSAAVQTGAEREYVRGAMEGVAYRIWKASTGRDEFAK